MAAMPLYIVPAQGAVALAACCLCVKRKELDVLPHESVLNKLPKKRSMVVPRA